MPLHSSLNFRNPALQALIPTILTAFGIQALVSVPCIILKDDRFYDLSGSLTFFACTGLSLYLSSSRQTLNLAGKLDTQSLWRGLKTSGSIKLVLSAMVVLWAGRLGTFLFERAMKAGKDSRFDEIKTNPVKFFGAFMAQATWVTLVAAPVIAVNSIPAARLPALAWTEGLGIAIWLFGFAFEIVADRQKSHWRSEKNAKKHDESFISSGLWATSRHPNYFGESLLWTGTALTASRSLSVAGVYPRYAGILAFIAPAFVTFLTQCVSGVPLLEEKMDKAGDKDWESYKKHTPRFFPKLPAQ